MGISISSTSSLVTPLTIMALFVSCVSDMQRVKTITSIRGLPSQSATNIEIIHTDSAKITMIVIAPKLNKYDNVDEPYTEFPEGLHVKFYNEFEETDANLTANYAIRDDESNIWEARYDVVAIGKEGQILNTELLFWDEEKEIIYTDEFVKITEDESIMYGTGFESDQNFDNWRILNPTGTVYTDE